MADLRLAIVTSRFWPLIDDRSLHLLRLSEALIDAGHKVSVVTPRWTRAWPERVAIGTVDVIRLPGSGTGSIGALRWMVSLGRWFRREQPAIVLVDGLKREAAIARTATERQQTSAVFLAGEDDLDWFQRTFGQRAGDRRQKTSAIVAPTSQLAESLSKLQNVTVIGRAAAALEVRSVKTRDAARLALAAVNYDLATAPNSIVALAVGRLDANERQGDLIRAWRIVTARRPEAKLWIVGDGPFRERLYQQIGDLDQRFRVMLPGMFERLDELLLACDLLLVPAPRSVPPLVLLDALSSGIPVVAADCAATRHVTPPSESNLLYPPGDVKALAEAVLRIMESSGQPKSFVADLPARTAAEEAAEYLALIERLQSNST